MVLATFARLWYARMLQAAPSTPSPRNGPVVRVGSGPADRILLFGNGPLHGWGVTRRELSAPGQLAEALYVRTGRAASVEYVGDERMNAASAAAWLGTAAGHGHDVAVIAIGMNDALRLCRVRIWRGHVLHLVERVLREGDASARVLLVGLPHIRSYVMADSWMGSIARGRAEEMTAVLIEIAATNARVQFVPAPIEQFEHDRPIGSSAMYRTWADGLTDHVVPWLDEARTRRPPNPEPEARWDWPGASAAIERSVSGVVSARLEGVVDAVQARFDVALAAVNLLEGDRTYFIAGGAGAPRSMPRSLAYCDVAVQEDEPLVVLDAKKDPRFRDNPFLDVVGLPFYAGVPLHARDGRAIATLCVLDTSPRSSFDAAMLRRFASEAEQELQALESDVDASVDAVPTLRSERAAL